MAKIKVSRKPEPEVVFVLVANKHYPETDNVVRMRIADAREVFQTNEGFRISTYNGTQIDCTTYDFIATRLILSNGWGKGNTYGY